MDPDVSAFILAGGKSTRMGTDKAFVALNGRTLLARALAVARSVTSAVYIVGAREKFSPFGPVIEDVFAGCGPLAGIHAALQESEADLNLILAVDLPFISPALLQFLITRARNSSTSTVTVPRTAQGWQPLCAIYRLGFAEVAKKALREGRYKIDALYDQAQMHVITEQELQSAGFSAAAFRNLNTPEELADAH